MKQTSLLLDTPKPVNKVDLIIGDHNKEAVDFLFDKFISSSEKIVLIYGAQKVGKSYITNAFISERLGKTICKESIKSIESIENLLNSNNILLLEDIDSIGYYREEDLFYLYNLAFNNNSKVILTSSVSPANIPFKLPDLKSRLLGTKAVSIKEPSPKMLKIILFKMLADKHLKVNIKVIDYIINRVERTSLAVYNIVEQINNELILANKPVTINTVKQILHS